jgi:hypothetical protein
MSDVITALCVEVPDKDKRQRIYARLIRAFEDMDCDTLGECAGDDSAFDAALKEAGHDID